MKRAAKTPQARENQLINLATDLAEKQLRDGSATSQVITHFLRLGTIKEQLENDRLRAELKLVQAKAAYLEDQATSKDLYEKAIQAFRLYSGKKGIEDDDENSYEDVQ